MINLAGIERKTSQYILVISIMLFIGSLFMPFILVNLIQKALYNTKEIMYFKTPPSSYVTFGVGMMWIALVLLVFVITKKKFELGKLKWLSLLFIPLSIPFFMFSIENYYYLDKEGIHSNELSSYKSVETFRWDEIKEVKEIYANEKGMTKTKAYKFITKDNRVFELPHHKNIIPFRAGLMDMLRENKVTITDNYDEL
ncbi:hypothetical protein [Neobacillus sp. YIM B06451]|uniref:hypothetical protein n=1 Tax=Neobacillus sp. YIM B06451 TaxID=3070994 RepID=UPI00292D0F3A|nr:hypothetical protein [Neobacillus sp. YIM B06451]